MTQKKAEDVKEVKAPGKTPEVVAGKPVITSSVPPGAPVVSDEDKLKKAASPDEKAAAERPADAEKLTPEEVSQAVDARDQRERRGIDQRPVGEGDRWVRDADLRAGFDRERPAGTSGGPPVLEYAIMVYSDGSAKVNRYATKQIFDESNVLRFDTGAHIGVVDVPEEDGFALYEGLSRYNRIPEDDLAEAEAEAKAQAEAEAEAAAGK